MQDSATDYVSSLEPATAHAPAQETQARIYPPYPLDAPDFKLHFPVKWSGKAGQIEVIHHLKRPTSGQVLEYRRLGTYDRAVSKTGEAQETQGESKAAHWLWDQLILAVGGYPGQPPGLVPVSDKPDDPIRAKMRGFHKEQAIKFLFAASAEVVEAESETFFDGGEWVVRLNIGARVGRPDFVLKLRLREWTEKERSSFEAQGKSERQRSEGKTVITSTRINLNAFADLFDALLISCEGASLNDRPAMEAGREAVCAGIFGEWKMYIITELVRTWKADLSDSP